MFRGVQFILVSSMTYRSTFALKSLFCNWTSNCDLFCSAVLTQTILITSWDRARSSECSQLPSTGVSYDCID